MLERRGYLAQLGSLARTFPAVAVLGPRQCGKSTLVRQFAESAPGKTHYFDLERAADAARLSTAPEQDLGQLQREPCLICIDEVQRLPELFALLRPLLDDRQRRARYILLGSASPGVIRGVSESLAGRVGFLDLTPFLLAELPSGKQPNATRRWVRGGFPPSLLARSERESWLWREAYFRSFVERDLLELGLGLAPVALRRLLTLMAHTHGGILNQSEIATAMGLSGPTIARYVDLLEGTFLVGRLAPYFANVGKRLVKRPKLYVSDSGVLHTLLGISSHDALRAHPKVGASWEGFIIGQILGSLRLANETVSAFYWRTHGGAEVDLLLELRGRLIPIEIKLADVPRAERGLHECMADLSVSRGFVAYPGYPGTAPHPVGERVWALPWHAIAEPKELVRLLTAR